jgi:hypothetical protein
MQFGNIFIEATANNSVKTRSDFHVIGYDDLFRGAFGAEFLVAGGGATFTALQGTVSFVADSISTNSVVRVASLSTKSLQFANILSDNAVHLIVKPGDDI